MQDAPSPEAATCPARLGADLCKTCKHETQLCLRHWTPNRRRGLSPRPSTLVGALLDAALLMQSRRRLVENSSFLRSDSRFPSKAPDSRL